MRFISRCQLGGDIQNSMFTSIKTRTIEYTTPRRQVQNIVWCLQARWSTFSWLGFCGDDGAGGAMVMAVTTGIHNHAIRGLLWGGGIIISQNVLNTPWVIYHGLPKLIDLLKKIHSGKRTHCLVLFAVFILWGVAGAASINIHHGMEISVQVGNSLNKWKVMPAGVNAPEAVFLDVSGSCLPIFM